LSLKKRIIPIVLLDGFSVVKTIKFEERRNLGSPVTVVRTYNTRNVDEMIVLDIDASSEGRSIDLFTISDLAKDCFMPLTVGGGIRSVEDIRAVLKAGADKVAINTAALTSPSIIDQAAKVFGSQCIVASVDIIAEADEYEIYNAQLPNRSAKSVREWVCELENRGAGEILINMVDLDGTMSSPNIDLAAELSRQLQVPTLYAGGISGPPDFVSLGKTDLSAVCASSIFHFTNVTPMECKLAMAEAGIEVRLS
jgi:cyclase